MMQPLNPYSSEPSTTSPPSSSYHEGEGDAYASGSASAPHGRGSPHYEGEGHGDDAAHSAESQAGRQRVRLLLGFLIVVVLILGAYFYWISQELNRIQHPSILIPEATAPQAKMGINMGKPEVAQGLKMPAIAIATKTREALPSLALAGTSGAQQPAGESIQDNKTPKTPVASLPSSTASALTAPEQDTARPREAMADAKVIPFQKIAGIDVLNAALPHDMPLLALAKSEKKTIMAEPETVKSADETALSAIEIKVTHTDRPVEEEAYGYLEKSEWGKARRAYEDVLAVHPDHKEAPLALAYLDVQQGRIQAAIQRYKDYLLKMPDNKAAQAGLAMLMQREAKNGEEISEEQPHPEGPAEAGYQAAGQKKWDRAYTYFKRAFHHAASAEVAYNAAIAADHLGKTKEAIRFYESALALEKSSEDEQHEDDQVAVFDTEAVRNRIVALQASMPDASSSPTSMNAQMALDASLSLPANE